MTDLQNDSASDTEKALEDTAAKRANRGILMLALLVFMPLIVFYIQYSVPRYVVLLIVVIFAALAMVGATLVGYYGRGRILFFHNLSILKQLAPPDPRIVGRSAILERDPVYAIATWGSNAIMLVAFFQRERSFNIKTRVPRVIWRWEYKHEIGDISVARREGVYSIPIGGSEYYSGEGVLYALLTERWGSLSVPETFLTENLQMIFDRLADELTSYEFGTSTSGGTHTQSDIEDRTSVTNCRSRNPEYT